VDNCLVCEREHSFSWCDTHGVGQCFSCGAPYLIYHYEKDDEGKERRVEKPPEIMLDEKEIERVKRFHAKTNGRLSAVGMKLSFPGGYDVANKHDIDLWNQFTKGQKVSL